MSKLKITYVGHATFLIEMEGQFILTDPNFSRKALLCKRLKDPGIKPEQIPPLTAIVITHANYSHLDLFSFKYFPLKVPILVPQGLGKFIQKFLRNPIIELPPWGEHSFENLKIYSVPVKHHGFRWSGLRWRAATGYLFEKGGETLFFPGDTGYGDQFKEVSNLHKVKTALLPIGHYHPHWLKKGCQMSPTEALQAYRDLKAEIMIPYHWGTFHSPFEKPEVPLEKLKEILKGKSNDKIKILEAGQSFSAS